MVQFVARVIWFVWCWIELAIFTAILYFLSWLPKAWLYPWYFPLFRLWCRLFVYALGVDLRLHQKNLKPLPKKYILIANHPSALEDVGIPTLFPVYSLAKEELKTWWWAGRINIAAGTLFVQRESAASRRAAAEQLIAELKKEGIQVHHVEGLEQGRWVLLDYVDFVVHLFHPTLRSFYQLERLWSDAEAIEISPEGALQ